MHYVYILRCVDDSSYVGSARDLDRRVKAHNDGRHAAHTFKQRPVQLVYSEAFESETAAVSRERQLKHRSHEKKQALVEGNKPRALRAIIEAFLDWSVLADSGYVSRPLPPDDSRLHQGVDERGDAAISRWWWVSFFKGTREQQEARSRNRGRTPQFCKPLNQQEPPVRFQGGAGCEDAYLQERRSKNSRRRR